MVLMSEMDTGTHISLRVSVQSYNVSLFPSLWSRLGATFHEEFEEVLYNWSSNVNPPKNTTNFMVKETMKLIILS